ncbi:MAG: FAD-dependent oxidoreductase [Erythrobacter sp.]|nr:FAD-dependent oxidoreductase [Erythrobacter sp.]
MVTRRGFLAGSSAAIVAGAAPRMAWGRTEVDVAIIGAGLAGLNAARVCEAAGLTVVVLEAENRIGGRLHTLDDLPGKPDAGGIQIGAGYKRLHSIAGELGVVLSGDAGAGAGRVQTPGNLYSIGGKSSTASSWSDSLANRLSQEERDTEPASLLRRYARALPTWTEPQAWLDAPAELDISVEQALRSAGASGEARRLIATNFNGNDLASMSQLHLARSFAIFRSQPGPVSTIVGGSQRLPEAMAAALKADVRLGEKVTAIVEQPGGVILRLSDYTLSARQVVCTVPFAAMRHIPMQARLSPHMAKMIAQLPYTRASFAYIRAKTPFWESDPYPDTLWTDDPLIGRIFVLGSDPAMLKLWTTGAGADMLDRLPRREAERQIIARIESARPSAMGQLEVLRLYSWQRNPHARGIYHHIGTGMAADLANATRDADSLLHFAGEHLAVASSGMEGALESGEEAALRVLAQS